MSETVGERLRRLRNERKLSQRDLAGPGVTGAYVSRLESGERSPSIKALRLLARKLRVSVSYLETGRELTDSEERDIRLTDAELRLRLGELTAELDRELQRLLEEAWQAGDSAAERRAQIALGLAAAHRGQHEQAIERLERVIGAADVAPASHPDVYTTLGHSYSETGCAAEAIQLFQDCLQQLDQDEADNAADYVRFATQLSYALADAGQLAAAQTIVNEALERAATLEDPYARVRLYWSRARLASMTGDSTSALSNIRRAITLLKETEDSLHLGLAYLLQGEFLLEANKLDQADSSLQLAAQLIGGADAQHQAGLRAEQAKLAARQGQAQRALELAQEALATVGEQTPAEEGRAHWALAEAHGAAGDTAAATREFEQAEQLLTGEGRYLTQLLKARATLARNTGNTDEAISLLERATEIAAQRQPPTRPRTPTSKDRRA